MSPGAGLNTQTYGVGTGRISLANWFRHTTGWKMVYNEMVEFWGSLAELITYKITGRLSLEGRTPSFVNGQSAAIAVTNGLVLVTRNSSDFEVYSGLRLESWHTGDH